MDPVPFRGTERQLTISNDSHAALVPAAPTLGSMVFLELASCREAVLSEEDRDSVAAKRVVCVRTLPAQLCSCARDCRFNIQKTPRYPSLLRNAIHGTSDPGARPSNHRSYFTRRAWVLNHAMIKCSRLRSDNTTRPAPSFFPSARGASHRGAWLRMLHVTWPTEPDALLISAINYPYRDT